ncbi:hypothetical protein IC582_006107 [Cucumis melo]
MKLICSHIYLLRFESSYNSLRDLFDIKRKGGWKRREGEKRQRCGERERNE